MYTSTEFQKFYHSTFRPQAEKCAKGFHMCTLIERGENPDETDPMYEHIKNCIDPSAIWHIGVLIGDIDKALIKGKRLTTINSVATVHSCLTSDDYWKTLWPAEMQTTEEYQNLIALKAMLAEFVALFGQTVQASTL